MSNNSAIAAALALPAKPDASPVEMAVVQVVEQRARTRKDADGKAVVVRSAIPIGHVHQTVMLPERTSFQPPARSAMIPAGGLRAGDIATPAQLAPVLGGSHGVKIGAQRMPKG